MLALDKAQNYMVQKRMHEISDWGSVELDEEGKALQVELEERQTVSLHFWKISASGGLLTLE